MAFGMSPFPFGFKTRQGGGGDPTAITPANADAFLASLGLTQAGTGTTWGETGQAATPLYAVGAAKVPLAVETIGGTQYFGPIVNPAGTNLALYDRDATNAAWSKSNITPTLQTGSLSDAGAANGHSLLTATDANGTCLQAITSGSAARVTKFWLARETGSGTVEITQDNGSTWTAVSLTSNPQPFNIAAATLANPTIGIRIVTSGDAVRLYGVQHQVAGRPLRPYIGPTAGSTVTTGARTLSRTFSGTPSELNFSMILASPHFQSFCIPFEVHNGSNTFFYIYLSSDGTMTLRKTISGSTTTTNDTFPELVENQTFKLDVTWIGTNLSIAYNDGTPVVQGGAALPAFTTMLLGGDRDVTRNWRAPILAFRDNIGNLLGGDLGWNHSLLDNWA